MGRAFCKAGGAQCPRPPRTKSPGISVRRVAASTGAPAGQFAETREIPPPRLRPAGGRTVQNWPRAKCPGERAPRPCRTKRPGLSAWESAPGGLPGLEDGALFRVPPPLLPSPPHARPLLPADYTSTGASAPVRGLSLKAPTQTDPWPQSVRLATRGRGARSAPRLQKLPSSKAEPPRPGTAGCAAVPRPPGFRELLPPAGTPSFASGARSPFPLSLIVSTPSRSPLPRVWHRSLMTFIERPHVPAPGLQP